MNYTSYDGNGNLLSKTDARGITTTFHYDGLNRVYQKGYSDATPGVTYSYDTGTNGKGHLTQVTSSVSTTHYGPFDAMGRVTASSQVTDAQTYAFSYGYNLAGGMTSQTYLSGRTVTTSYDAAGRASRVSGPGNEIYVSTISYAAHGAMQTMALGNGLTETLSYNSRLQPLSIGVGSLVSLGYDYGTTNNNGNVLSQTITAPGFNVTQSYSYNDAMNRLTGISESSGWSQTYGYDRYGNRNAGTSTSPYMPLLVPTISQTNNRITAANYAYDNAGNLTQWPTAPGSSVYDAENKMISFNGGAATYSYDGEGRRVRKAAGGTTTVFVYNAMGQMVAEYSGAAPSNGGTQYIIADHLGSTRVVMDGGGAVVARHDYLPFGEEISSGIGGRTTAMGYAAADGVRQKFTSKERDSETGLDYFLARYYSSTQGRFLSPDEFAGGPDFLFGAGESSGGPLPYANITDPQSLNKYVYVYNRPLAYTDEDGHKGLFAAALDWTVQFLTRPPSPPPPSPPMNSQVAYLVVAQDAARSANQPERGGRTFCNNAVFQQASAMGAPLGPLSNNDPRGRGTPAATANEMANNLAHSNQYHAVSAAEAQQRANRGVLVIGVQPHAGHGHVATVRPDTFHDTVHNSGGRGPLMNNVGRVVGIYSSQGPAGNRTFLNSPAPVYYTPN